MYLYTVIIIFKVARKVKLFSGSKNYVVDYPYPCTVPEEADRYWFLMYPFKDDFVCFTKPLLISFCSGSVL
jgi:hypothetical protein